MSQIRSDSPISILENINRNDSTFNKIKIFVETVEDSLDEVSNESLVKFLKICTYHIYKFQDQCPKPSLAICMETIIADQNKAETDTKLYYFIDSMVFIMLINSLGRVGAPQKHIDDIKPKLDSCLEKFKNC
jgi:hypothetical protein